MASVVRLSVQLTTLAALSLVGSWAIAADCGCSHCGCKQTKKMTRLVASLETIEAPVYQCITAKSFHPKKGIVCHSGYRCDKFYKLHTKWCCQEHCVCQEHCEDVTHYVDKNPCDSECECHTEHHHEKHFDYQISCRCPRVCELSSRTRLQDSLWSLPQVGVARRYAPSSPRARYVRATCRSCVGLLFMSAPNATHRWSADKTESH